MRNVKSQGVQCCQKRVLVIFSKHVEDINVLYMLEYICAKRPSPSWYKLEKKRCQSHWSSEQVLCLMVQHIFFISGKV